MDAKVIVTTYEELPRHRRRSVNHGAPPTSTPRLQASGGRHNRRALLLAYARQLRRRRVGLQQISSGPPLLEWGEWKTTDRPVVGGAGGDDVTTGSGTRSWYSRLRCCVRLWIKTFRRRVRRIRENASCKQTTGD